MKKKLLTTVVALGLTMGGAIGFAAPANAAVPSCVSVSYTNSSDFLSTTVTGRAASGCSYTTTGRWSISEVGVGTFYGGCVSLAPFAINQVSETHSNIDGSGYYINGFVSC